MKIRYKTRYFLPVKSFLVFEAKIATQKNFKKTLKPRLMGKDKSLRYNPKNKVGLS